MFERRRKIHTLFVIISAFIAPAAMAQATYNWDGGASGDWDVASNWDQDAVPNSVNHKVVIGSATVRLDMSVVVGELVIEHDATLNICSDTVLDIDRGFSSPTQNGLLTIETSSDESTYGVINVRANGEIRFGFNDGDHMIGGNVVLHTSTSRLKIGNADATFGPYIDVMHEVHRGNIVGHHDDALFLIEEDLVINIGITIMGHLTIGKDEGTGSTNPMMYLLGTGLIWSNAGGILTLDSQVELNDVSGSFWASTTYDSSTLKFSDSAELSGYMILDDCAIFELCPSVEITAKSGLFDLRGGLFAGTIIAEDGAEFSGCSFDPPRSCLTLADDTYTSTSCAQDP